MSRWIDAEWLKQNFNTAFWSQITKTIDSAPSIDIVRCEECKYEPICSHSVQHTTHELTSVTIGYKSVNYCSYGERREP